MNKKEIRWVKNEKGCMICVSHARNQGGYALRRDKKDGKHKALHKILWEEQHGALPKGMVLLHSCDNPSCINLEHLSVGTRLDNVQDAKVKGRMKRKGTESFVRKLRPKQVIDIWNDQEHTIAELARRYGVSPSLISDIRAKRVHRWLIEDFGRKDR